MKKFKTVFKYTYLWNIKTKGFIITTIIGVILLGLTMNFNIIKDKIMGSSEKKIAVCDYDNSFALNDDIFKDADFENSSFEVIDKGSIDDTKETLSNGKGDIDCLITMYSKDKETIEVFSKNNSDSDTIRSIVSSLKTMYISNRAVNSNIDVATMQNLMADVPVNMIESDEEKEGNTFFVYFLVLILYMVIMFYGMDVLNSVVEEKNNRIMETLITMANPLELFFGKVLGVCAVTLTQLAVLIAAGACFINLNDEVLSLIEKLNINFNAGVIFNFSAFIILGYLLYSFIFAALGSLVSSTQDSSQAVMPITFFLMAIMAGGLISLTNTESVFAVVMSYVPFSSPIFMFERAVLSDVPTVNVLISLAILILSIFLIGAASSRVYKKGVLHYGKRASFFKVLLNK